MMILLCPHNLRRRRLISLCSTGGSGGEAEVAAEAEAGGWPGFLFFLFLFGDERARDYMTDFVFLGVII